MCAPKRLELKPRHSLTRRLVLPILLASSVAAVGGFGIAAYLANARLGTEGEQTAQDQLIALETVVNVSDLTGLQRATTAVGAGRDVDVVFVAGGDPQVILASSNTSLIGSPLASVGSELLSATVGLSDPLSVSFHTTRNGDTIVSAGRFQVRETGRDGTDFSNAMGVIQLDISAMAEEVEEDLLIVALGGVAAVVAIAVLAILLIRRHVLQPLRSIAANVSRGAASNKTGCDEGCSSTEVCQLAQALHRALVERDESQARLADANQQLQTSNQRLGRLVESKDQFLASVSHELRTPLTAILGFAQHLKDVDSALSSRERTAIIETICNEGADVGHLIEDLLTAARADIDRLDVASVRVDLLAQARQVVEGLAGKLGDVAVVGDPTLVVADPSRVRQVARNLLTNAARYGGSEVLVHVGCRDGHGVLWVIDDGPGIDDADLERIFERYESAHERGRVADSVGIGLAVSRTLARLMSGDLMYERRDDRSVFELRLPVMTQSGEEIEGLVAAQPDTVTAG